jgi:hypothetical protein
MHAIKVTCPLCQGVTNVKGTSPLGQSVHCQRCGAPFTVAAEDIRRANLELAESRAIQVPAAIAGPEANAPWWVDAQETTTPSRPVPMPVRMGVLANEPSAPQAPALEATAGHFQATLKMAPVALAPAGKPSAAGVPAPTPSSANRLVALGLLGGGMLLVLGFGVALGIICLADPSPEEENAAQTSLPKTTKKILLPTDKQAPVQPEPPPEPQQPVPEVNPNPNPNPPPQPRPHPRRPGEELVENDPPDMKVPKEKDPLLQPKGVKPLPGNKHVVTPAKQKEIDKAIDSGVKYLKGNYKGDGTWGFGTGHDLGTSALSALVLMECGVPPSDPCVAGAANYVRKHWKDNRATYEIALAILFLDKLGEKVGDKKDKGIITALALRLLHAQNNVGGWSYNCQILTPTEATQLMTALKKSRPKLPTLIVKDPVTTPPVSLSLPDQIRMLNPLEKASGLSLPSGIDKSKPGDMPPGIDKSKPSTSSKRETPSGGSDAPPSADNDTKIPGEKAQFVRAQQPPKGAAVQPPKGPKDNKGPNIVVPKGGDDNSNTQFAILALWAARRYDVPVENALLLAEQRYRTSQHTSGGWGYHYNAPNDTASMTCVGLLGLAVGKGVNAEMKIKAGHKDAKMSLLDDRAKKGLAILVPHLEKRAVNAPNFPQGLSLYYMWSLERVGVLYDLIKIGDREWYLWGVDILLPTQRAIGSWETGSYHGSNPTIDTCFALLFLKRVNFVQDLTDLTLPTIIPESNPLPK